MTEIFPTYGSTSALDWAKETYPDFPWDEVANTEQLSIHDAKRLAERWTTDRMRELGEDWDVHEMREISKLIPSIQEEQRENLAEAAALRETFVAQFEAALQEDSTLEGHLDLEIQKQ